MNLPNKITVSRAAMTPVLILLMSLEGEGCNIAAACVFAVASASDLLDGYIARSRNLITDFGRFADPIADKLIVTSAMLMLVQQGRMTGWLAMVFIGREFVVSALRMIAAAKGRVVAADKLGKYKTLAQTFAVLATVLFKPVSPALTVFADALMYVAAILAVWSCVDYMLKNRDVLVL